MILNSTQTFVRKLSSKKISWINHRKRITFHHGNLSSHTSAQITSFLSTQNIDLIIHPTSNCGLVLNDFCYSCSWKTREVNVFLHLKKRLLHYECMFWRYLNHSGKSSSDVSWGSSKRRMLHVWRRSSKAQPLQMVTKKFMRLNAHCWPDATHLLSVHSASPENFCYHLRCCFFVSFPNVDLLRIALCLRNISKKKVIFDD